ncbi:MAG: nonstructural protein [Microviridae sp.]|nr:MAG: nonstructural protein [Microviridae sp.]
MKMYVCAVMDKKVMAYVQPAFFRTKGEATRAFMDAVAAENSPMRRHAEDYVFCFLGFYDDHEGRFENAAVPEILMSALDCVAIDGGIN